MEGSQFTQLVDLSVDVRQSLLSFVVVAADLSLALLELADVTALAGR